LWRASFADFISESCSLSVQLVAMFWSRSLSHVSS
jgi:hypothetical protein